MKTRQRRSIDVPVDADPTVDDFSDWAEVGTYNRGSRSFRVERIPAPPEAKSVRMDDIASGEASIGYHVSCACPHCVEDVDFVFAQSYSSEVLKDLDRLKREVESLRFENSLLTSMLLVARAHSIGAEESADDDEANPRADLPEGQRRAGVPRRRRDTRRH